MLFLTALTFPSTARAEDGASIASQMAANGAGYHDMVATVQMEMTNDRGKTATRVMKLSTLERPAQDGDFSLLVFESPADVSGTALLSQPGVTGDKQWLYLPALKRSQRISGGNRTGAFVGSEFTYEDVSGAAIGKHTWTLQGEQPCGTATCFVLKTVPAYDGSGYAHRMVWVDKEGLRPQKIEFYDRQGTHLKTLTYTDYEHIDGKHWRARTWSMQNQQTGRSTTLRFQQLALATGLGEDDFAPAVLR